MQLLLFKNSPQLLWISRKVHECEVIASSSFFMTRALLSLCRYTDTIRLSAMVMYFLSEPLV